jgi:hypothetical protein
MSTERAADPDVPYKNMGIVHTQLVQEVDSDGTVWVVQETGDKRETLAQSQHNENAYERKQTGDSSLVVRPIMINPVAWPLRG